MNEFCRARDGMWWFSALRPVVFGQFPVSCDVPYQSLLKIYLAERLSQERRE